VTWAVAVFALTYAASAGARIPGLSLDRPAAALLGAVLMVALGVLTPAQAGAAVNGDTIGLLLGMMILAAYLTEPASSAGAAGRSSPRSRRRGHCCGDSPSRPEGCRPSW